MSKTMHKQLRAAAICTATLLLVCFMIGYFLPWISEAGYAGEVIQYGYQNRRDATPLFYTESERTWDIMQRIDSEENTKSIQQ